MQNVFNLEREIALATEAWMIEYNLPLPKGRQFTHEELAPALEKVRAEIARAERAMNGEPTYWDEKRLDRREEFAEEDDINAQRAYPERRP